jgi:ATP-binding cassette, subfamily B, bacterial MsbA
VGRYGQLFRFVRPYLALVAAALVATLIGTLFDGFTFALVIPFLRAVFGQSSLLPPEGTNLVDRVLHQVVGPLLKSGNLQAELRNVIAVILAAMLLKNLLVYFSRVSVAVVQEKVVRDLRMRLYAHLQGMGLGYFQHTKGGQLLSRMLADAENVKPIVGNEALNFVQSIATLVVYLVILIALSWRLTLLALVLAPVLIVGLRPLVRRLHRGYLRTLDDRGDLTALMQETIAGVRLVKAYAAEPYERDRFFAAADRYARGVIRMQRLATLSGPISETFGALVTVVLLWVGATMATAPAAQIGPEGFIMFLFVALRLLVPLKFLSNWPAQYQNCLASGERVLQVLDEPPTEALASGRTEVRAFRDAIVFRDVAFAYDGQAPVLQDINLDARKGEVVAIVGASGAGKSTLVDLLPRFYEPTGGSITLDGADLREIALPTLRSLMGIVSQETVLFNDSVKANIAYGALDRFDAAAIEAAAQAANAHEFISGLPSGYDTLLGERGTRLSGGERQRIAIARALLRDPPILILDEATSALDSEAEHLVQGAIDRLLEGRTVFVIAHRLSTVQHATQILVLDRGRIVERGRHEALLAAGGVYHRLYTLQFGAEPRPALVD